MKCEWLGTVHCHNTSAPSLFPIIRYGINITLSYIRWRFQVLHANGYYYSMISQLFRFGQVSLFLDKVVPMHSHGVVSGIIHRLASCHICSNWEWKNCHFWAGYSKTSHAVCWSSAQRKNSLWWVIFSILLEKVNWRFSELLRFLWWIFSGFRRPKD